METNEDGLQTQARPSRWESVMDRDTYEVDGVRIACIRDEAGTRWQCERCEDDCEHIMKARDCMTRRRVLKFRLI